MTAPQLKPNITTAPVTQVTLTIAKPLLIVLTPMSAKKAWWSTRKGLLYMRPDGVLAWYSDDFIANEPYGKTMTDINMGFKHLFKEGWSILLSKPDCNWGELSFEPCEYSTNQVLIPVYPSTFTLGDRN
jgi:hypothetical protein